MEDSIVILLYILLSCVMSFLCTQVLPKIFRKHEKYIFALFIVLSLFIPVLGLFAVLVITALSYRAKTTLFPHYIKPIEMPSFSREHKINIETYGEGEAYAELHHVELPTAERVSLLAAINSFSARLANRINQALLSDADYEVRLYAFSALNNQESEINTEIAKNLSTLNTANNFRKKAQLEKQLAFLYWELVYRHLIEAELMDDIIKQIFYYMQSAQEVLHNDVDLWVLQGRVYLSQNAYDEAQHAFNQALQFNVSPNKIIPYLAEMHFILKNYHEVKRSLQQSDTLQDIPMLSALVNFWSTV